MDSLVLRLQYMAVTMGSPSLILKINFLSFARYMFPQIPGTSCKLVTDGDEASHFYTIHFKILHLLHAPSKDNDLQWEKIHSAKRKAGNGVKCIFFILSKSFLLIKTFNEDGDSFQYFCNIMALKITVKNRHLHSLKRNGHGRMTFILVKYNSRLRKKYRPYIHQGL